MPDVQNVFRRGAAYWWRRSLAWADGNSDPITLSFSLGTKDLSVARRRAAAMTARSEAVRMSLYERVAREGLTAVERDDVLRAELRDYRDGLQQLTAEWQLKSAWAKVTDVDADLLVYEAIWSAFAKTGVVDGAPDIAYADQHFGALNDEQRAAARRLLGSVQIRDALQADAATRLRTLGIEPNATNMALACRIILDARAQASREVRLGTTAAAETALAPARTPRPEVAPIVSSPRDVKSMIDGNHVPEKWRNLTPVEAAELLIRGNPAMFDHRKQGKRAGTTVGEQTLRQIRWAAVLLQKSMNPDGLHAGVRPMWTCTFEDLVLLDRWFDKLPVTCGKSPWDRDSNTTLEAICQRAVDRIDSGELGADAIGLDGATTNKHLRKLKQIYDLARDEIDALPELKFSKFMVEDLKDDRSARDAYTVEQGQEIFLLPPWVGCRSVSDRLSSGDLVFHDSLFFVLLLVWYTGMRREEVCKLLVADIAIEHSIWHINIKRTEAGRVKNASSVRLVAICDELTRLGFLKYVEAVKQSGYAALFPELVSEREGAKKGDVFYKIWWIYIAPLLTGLRRGQALHAARHTFDTELKELEVFPEHREDALGHAGDHGEGRRYSKATRLRKLKALVDKVPVVTAHLPDNTEVRLLPDAMLLPRAKRT